MAFTTNPPLSLYIHLPWCERKCPYCDFNSHADENIPESAYIDALIEDLIVDLPLVWGRQIHSIFIGGGTPSLFSSEAIAELISQLRACLNFAPTVEITLESNPGSADADRFRGYREAGINRLSIGIQSFNNDHLLSLGRIHNSQQALSAITKAREAGFSNINLDLMYGLPAQTLEQAIEDLEMALDQQPTHLSHYQLTIEPNTHFHSRTPETLPDIELLVDMQETCQSVLALRGYEHYEISAYTREKHYAQHNLNYWQFGDYLGIGAGAHGKITLAGENRILRRQRIRQPAAYLQQSAEQRVSVEQALSVTDRVFEFMLNALRLVKGFDLAMFKKHTGLSSTVMEQALNEAINKGLIEINNTWLKPTQLGLQFHNDLQAIFLDANLSPENQVEPSIDFKIDRLR